MFDLSWSGGASQFLWMSYLVVGMTKTLEGTGVSIEASMICADGRPLTGCATLLLMVQRTTTGETNELKN